ncbi:MAG: DNA topoisomerase, partial [Oscillospiraceae bacterium]
MSNLIIVESPAKAKTIEKYLGKGYQVIASMGHVRDLPKSTIGVDFENDFTPKYITIKGKGDLVKKLKLAAKKSDKIFLATDPDREGEAISWHLAHILGMDITQKNRITFNEITKTGVKYGMSHPRVIDQDLVDAQQARRILDRIVGYKLSPFLWQKVKKGLSAGRVQSVAVRLIVDREREITAFKVEEYWSIDAKLKVDTAKKTFGSKLSYHNGKKVAINKKEEANIILNEVKLENFIVSN